MNPLFNTYYKHVWYCPNIFVLLALYSRKYFCNYYKIKMMIQLLLDLYKAAFYSGYSSESW